MGTRKRFSFCKMQNFTSTISTTMVLILLGLVILMVLTAKVLGDSVRENLTVTIDLKDGIPAVQARELQGKLCEEAYVSEVTYISSEEALKEQRESMGVDPTDFLGANPFPISMEIRMKPEYACNDSLEWITGGLKENELVAEVVYQKDLVENLNKTMQRVSLVLLGIAALLIMVSLSLINNTVRLAVYSQRFIIHTMKLVGARWNFIRKPFMLQSMWIGIISATLADAFLLGCIQWAASYDKSILGYITIGNLGITALCVLLFGLTITMVCTYMSVTRYLRMRESDLY